jgi:hypothetical protein
LEDRSRSAYVDPAPAPLARVTGTLALGGILYTPRNGWPAGANPFITAQNTPQRKETDHSLNFVPAADATGSNRLATVTVVTDGDYCGQVQDSWESSLSWSERPPFPVHNPPRRTDRMTDRQGAGWRPLMVLAVRATLHSEPGWQRGLLDGETAK